MARKIEMLRNMVQFLTRYENFFKFAGVKLSDYQLETECEIFKHSDLAIASRWLRQEIQPAIDHINVLWREQADEYWQRVLQQEICDELHEVIDIRERFHALKQVAKQGTRPILFKERKRNVALRKITRGGQSSRRIRLGNENAKSTSKTS